MFDLLDVLLNILFELLPVGKAAKRQSSEPTAYERKTVRLLHSWCFSGTLSLRIRVALSWHVVIFMLTPSCLQFSAIILSRKEAVPERRPSHVNRRQQGQREPFL